MKNLLVLYDILCIDIYYHPIYCDRYSLGRSVQTLY